MIRKDLDFMLGSLEVVPPMGKTVDYGQELFIVHGVIDLGWGELPRVEGNGM